METPKNSCIAVETTICADVNICTNRSRLTNPQSSMRQFCEASYFNLDSSNTGGASEYCSPKIDKLKLQPFSMRASIMVKNLSGALSCSLK